MRHGDQRATDVAQLEDGAQKDRVVLCLATHGYHQCIDPLLFKVGVVDHRRLEGMCRKSNVGNDFGVAVDEHEETIKIKLIYLADLAADTAARSASR